MRGSMIFWRAIRSYRSLPLSRRYKDKTVCEKISESIAEFLHQHFPELYPALIQLDKNVHRVCFLDLRLDFPGPRDYFRLGV